MLEPNLRLEMIEQEIVRLLSISSAEFAAVMEALADVADHNVRHLVALDGAAGPPLGLSCTDAGAIAEPAKREAAALALSRQLREAAVQSRFAVPKRLVPEYQRTAVFPVVRERDEASRPRPRVAIISHLASSGGTAITKCIACMEGVTLLGEIHPTASVALPQFNPLYQYRRWYGLSDPLKAELDSLGNGGETTVADILECLAIDAARRGTTLVLRDWSHVDYVAGGGLPPRGRPSLLAVLAPRMETRLLVSMRHPLDIWLSMISSRFAKPDGLAFVMAGIRHFADYAVQNGVMTYEAFIADPDAWLTAATARLDVPFDPSWQKRWASYRNVTGDSGRRSGEIAPRPRRPVSEEMLALVNANADYRHACDLLGYD